MTDSDSRPKVLWACLFRLLCFFLPSAAVWRRSTEAAASAHTRPLLGWFLLLFKSQRR